MFKCVRAVDIIGDPAMRPLRPLCIAPCSSKEEERGTDMRQRGRTKKLQGVLKSGARSNAALNPVVTNEAVISCCETSYIENICSEFKLTKILKARVTSKIFMTT